MECEVMDCEQLPQHVIDSIVNRRILGLPEPTSQEIEMLKMGGPIARPTPTLKWQAEQKSSEHRNIVYAKRRRVKPEDCEYCD
jgi:hypothetical protein